jgi:hypothetical protein
MDISSGLKGLQTCGRKLPLMRNDIYGSEMKTFWLTVISSAILSAMPVIPRAAAQSTMLEMQSQQPTATPTVVPEPAPSSAATQSSAPTASPSPTPSAQAPVNTAYTAPSSTVGNAASPVCLCVKGKLKYFAAQSFRPGIYPVAAAYTGYTMVSPPSAYPPEWRQGFHGFARNFGDFMASWTAVQGGKFVVASALHEDPRYFPSKSKNLFARVFNAARFAVIDRSDMGNPRPAVSNIAGAFAGGFVGNAYLPDPYANASHGLSRSGYALLGFVTSNLADEFHPEIHKIATKLHLPLIGR